MTEKDYTDPVEGINKLVASLELSAKVLKDHQSAIADLQSLVRFATNLCGQLEKRIEQLERRIKELEHERSFGA